MSVRFSELHCKEVICVGDGRRLGFVSDVCVELPCGRVVSITVPGPAKFFGLGSRREDYMIPWDRIRRIGPDIILVDIDPDSCRVLRGKNLF